MMKKFARIENNKVIEVLEAQELPEMHPDLQWVECTNDVEQNWNFQNNVFSAPIATPRYVPQIVSMRQARLALLAVGHLETVHQAIAQMPGIEGDAARIDWEFASTVVRTSPLVESMVALLQLNEEQTDELFIAASAIE